MTSTHVATFIICLRALHLRFFLKPTLAGGVYCMRSSRQVPPLTRVEDRSEQGGGKGERPEYGGCLMKNTNP